MCKECLKYEERFNQLGVGWLLREMSVADQEGVVSLIEENKKLFIREGLRYAVEKMPKELKEELLAIDKPKKATRTLKK